MRFALGEPREPTHVSFGETVTNGMEVECEKEDKPTDDNMDEGDENSPKLQDSPAGKQQTNGSTEADNEVNFKLGFIIFVWEIRVGDPLIGAAIREQELGSMVEKLMDRVGLQLYIERPIKKRKRCPSY